MYCCLYCLITYRFAEQVCCMHPYSHPLLLIGAVYGCSGGAGWGDWEVWVWGAGHGGSVLESWRHVPACLPACLAGWLAGLAVLRRQCCIPSCFNAALPLGSCCLQAVGRDAEIGEEAIQQFIAAQFASAAGGGGGGGGGGGDH